MENLDRKKFRTQNKKSAKICVWFRKMKNDDLKRNIYKLKLIQKKGRTTCPQSLVIQIILMTPKGLIVNNYSNLTLFDPK